MTWTGLSPNKEWRETCERFCRDYGFELVCVRRNSIDAILKDGTLKRLYPMEMAAIASERLVASVVFG